jgi:hypothetical protein
LLVTGVVLVVIASSCAGDDGGSAAGQGDASTTTTVAGHVDTTDGESEGPALRVEAVSTRAEYVTGESVVLAIHGADDDATIATAGTEQPLEAAGPQAAHDAGLPAALDGARLVEVSDLSPGETTVTVSSGTEQATLDLTIHPVTGPLFSGPHQEPYFCTAESFGLTPPDDDCHAESLQRQRYLNSDGTWVEIEADTDVDPDTISTGGTGEPVVVDVEIGTINRAVYELAVPQGWNGVLVYSFGGGCGTGYWQGTFLGSEPIDSTELLAAGYAVASSTLNTFQTTCNDVISAETLMMVKEHFIETFGVPRWTIGQGGSGGAIQQYLIAQNYPGLLDALNPLVSFPDATSIAPGVTDCGLLENFWAGEAGSGFSDEQRLAVQGHGSLGFCAAWIETFVPVINPTVGCAVAVPRSLVYDPFVNETGARCTLQDANSNLFGTDENGLGRRPLDNVGVEYGRAALEAGTITVDQFLDLNEGIGGYDLDGNTTPERMAADLDVMEDAYRNGRVLHGDSAVAELPVIDVDLYSDLGFDIHDRFRLFSIRDRMEGPEGDPDGRTRVIWTREGGGLTNLVKAPLPTVEMIGLLTDWLEATTDGTPVAAARPEGLTDECEADGSPYEGDDLYQTQNGCTETFPIHGDPRTASGAPRANDIIKCTLRPVDVEAYGVPFDDAQTARLAGIFPDGTCDWSIPGQGQVPLGGTWLRYPDPDLEDAT